MKKTWLKLAAFIVAAALLAPAPLLAQKEKEEKEVKEKKEEKEEKEKKEGQQIIITRKNDKDEKVVVEIKGDKITINGKPIDEYKEKDGDISVRINKLKNLEFLTKVSGLKGNLNFNGGDNFKLFTEDANRAMLGVTTEKAELGAEVNTVSKDGAAEKMGLKEGDIITKVGDIKIENPDDLSAAIKTHKPGDKVTVTYLRDKKEQKATAELSKWKGMSNYNSTTPFQSFDFRDLNDMNLNLDKIMPNTRTLTTPRALKEGQNWSWSGSTPKLGLSVQDTDDGKGVKVIEVDDESNAEKAGIKEDDVVTEVDGKAVNSTDDMVKMIKESKDKISVMIKLQRAGKTQNIEVKMPRKIKTADL